MTETTKADSAASDPVGKAYRSRDANSRRDVHGRDRRDLAYELLDVETLKKPNSDVVIRMSIRQHEQLFFAIEDVYDRASAIEKLYQAE